jgi:preprotein translocase SecE subunit
MAQIIDNAMTFLKEVRDEFQKVSRPSWHELRNSTTVVIIATAMIGLIVGVLDIAFNGLVQLVLR